MLGPDRRTRMPLLLLLLAACVQLVAAAPSFPPRASSGPYRFTSAAAHWINVRGAAELEGAAAVQPAVIGSHWNVTGTLNGAAVWEGELMIPHVLDDPKACLAVNATLRRANELNETFAGKIMLLRRGTCAFGLKVEAAVQAGASGVIIHGCGTGAPTFCDPGLSTMSGTQNLPVPIMFMQSDDGFLLHDHLARRMAQRVRWLNPVVAAAAAAANETELVPVTLEVPSTGALDPLERAALVSIMSAAGATMIQDTTFVFGGNRAWNLTTLADPGTDPCLQRLAGLWCEDGHVVEVALQNVAFTGGLSPAFGALTHLRALDLSVNQLTGAVPPEWCLLTDLRSLWLSSQNTGQLDGVTSLPACMSQLHALAYVGVAGNALSAIPDFTNALGLVQLDCSANQIAGALPGDYTRLTKLELLSASQNKLTSLPSLKGHGNLTTVSFAGNALEFALPPDAFDGMAKLQSLDLSRNKLQGALPRLEGCASLESLLFSHNAFVGRIPASWSTALPALVTFKAAHNAITSPINPLGPLLHLQTIDLSHNALTASTGVALQENDVGALLSGTSGPSLANLDLSYNNIQGPWAQGWLTLARSLSVVNLGHNGLTSLPYDLLTYPFASLDVSHNNVSTWADNNTPGPAFVYLNLLSNPRLSVAKLPLWVVVGEQMFTNPGDSFACPALSSTSSVLMKFLVDSSFSHYAGCRCAKGTFGLPPLCHSVPLTATLLPDGSYSSAEVGSEFATVVGQAGSLANVTTVGALERSFSDGWYGDARLTLGLATSWVLDLRSAGTSALPVRHMVVRLHVSRALFSSETDVLTVYEGDGSLSGARVAQLRGTDALPSSSSAHTSSAEYQSQYAKQLAALGPQSVLEVLVLTPLATVSFSSRAESGTRFFATYSFATDCPVEHFLVAAAQRCVPCFAAEGNFFDAAQQRCRPNLVEYRVSDGIRAAVWATAGVAFVMVLLCAGMVVARWESPIIRAASRSFLLLLLAFLAMWPLGALLYAATPVAGTIAGELVCHVRVWLSAFPLSGILAVLLAKTNRVNTIFGSNKLVLRKMTDSDLLGTVAALLAGVSVLLAVFSGMQMARPDLSEGSGAHVNQLLRSCANDAAYTPWLGVLLAYIFVLCLGAAFLAWRTRDLPSRFNESGHIMNALLVLLFFGAMIVPLDALIQDNPEAAVLIQGVGQTLLCMLLTTVIFGPKAYLLMVSAPIDQNSMLGTTAAGGATNQSIMDDSSLDDVKGHATRNPARGSLAAGSMRMQRLTPQQSSAGATTHGSGITGPGGLGSPATPQQRSIMAPSRSFHPSPLQKPSQRLFSPASAGAVYVVEMQPPALTLPAAGLSSAGGGALSPNESGKSRGSSATRSIHGPVSPVGADECQSVAGTAHASSSRRATSGAVAPADQLTGLNQNHAPSCAPSPSVQHISITPSPTTPPLHPGASPVAAPSGSGTDLQLQAHAPLAASSERASAHSSSSDSSLFLPGQASS